ncbi:hypothetical protein Aspvir_002608 [Aspergillus viridinutans]|uniref:Uncharacterized protein n=1 Tax=Aspergillus viridinutans TaxID=75553 RepID=A0A9P3FA63_ASPVI|nr:uncharacterized protein Aspvir_002608 [Aspergillus viridinutans]GIK06955.1 hypothetical protein Aspvir_002608 [Aspergillus viridinutans]
MTQTSDTDDFGQRSEQYPASSNESGGDLQFVAVLDNHEITSRFRLPGQGQPMGAEIDVASVSRPESAGLFSVWHFASPKHCHYICLNLAIWKRNTKRLRHDIGFHGVKTAMERASGLIMQASWFDSHLLVNANDSDIALNLDYRITESARLYRTHSQVLDVQRPAAKLLRKS